jgi:hypothetical protein
MVIFDMPHILAYPRVHHGVSVLLEYLQNKDPAVKAGLHELVGYALFPRIGTYLLEATS